MNLILYIRQLEVYIRRDYTVSILSIYKVLRKNYKWSSIVILIYIFTGLLISFSLPKEYRSSIELSLEVSSSPVNTGSSQIMNLFLNSNKDAISIDSYPELISNQVAIETVSQFMLPIAVDDNYVIEKTMREIINDDTTKPWWNKIAYELMSPFMDDSDKEEIFINEVKRRIAVLSGKSKNVLIIETLMQDPLTSAALCDSIVNFLNTQLIKFSKQKLYHQLNFLQNQVDKKKQDYYQAMNDVGKFIDTHNGNLLMREQVIGNRLSQEARIKFESYLNTYKDLIIANFNYNHPQNRFFTIIPAHVAVKPTWPPKTAILFIFGSLGILFIIISATVMVTFKDLKPYENVK